MTITFEQLQLQRDEALDALERLVRVMRATGGFMEYVDQLALRWAVALLAENGRRI